MKLIGQLSDEQHTHSHTQSAVLMSTVNRQGTVTVSPGRSLPITKRFKETETNLSSFFFFYISKSSLEVLEFLTRFISEPASNLALFTFSFVNSEEVSFVVCAHHVSGRFLQDKIK